MSDVEPERIGAMVASLALDGDVDGTTDLVWAHLVLSIHVHDIEGAEPLMQRMGRGAVGVIDLVYRIDPDAAMRAADVITSSIRAAYERLSKETE